MCFVIFVIIVYELDYVLLLDDFFFFFFFFFFYDNNTQTEKTSTNLENNITRHKR